MSLFENKTLMITGGVGSFGNGVFNRFLATDIGEIRIFSNNMRLLIVEKIKEKIASLTYIQDELMKAGLV